MGSRQAEAGRALAVDEADPVTSEILRRYLISTVEEMVRTTVRTAYSTCFSEAEDFTCALFNERGEMVAQGMGLAVHAGALGIALQDILDRYYDRLDAGDVVITNDPWTGTHQADVTIVRPMFFEDVLLGYAVNRGHWVDIGGSAPGGWGGGATHVLQEALIIPPSRIYRRGELVREVREFILRNVRVPNYAWGDLQAQVASAITAERQLGTLCARYGVDALRRAEDEALEYSRNRFKKMMASVPDGEYSGEDYLENDGHSTERRVVRVKITKKDTRILVDFTGTDSQARGPINASFVATRAGVYSVLINVIDPEIPINSGVLDAVEIVAPIGTLVHATYPAPVFAGPADPTNRTAEAMMKALAPVMPNRVSAGSYATGNCTTGGGFRSDGSEFAWYSFGGGGCGGRAFADGLSAEWHVMASCKNESAETWENRYPLRMLDNRLRPDSAGAGEWRGGLGHIKAFELLEDHSISALADRHVEPPFGLAGGLEGTPNRLTLQLPGDEEERGFTEVYGIPSPSKFSNLNVPKGSIYRIYSGGGGGFGPPWKRPVDLVVGDVRAGYVTPDKAREHYGVAVDAHSFEVDESETHRLRDALKRKALLT